MTLVERIHQEMVAARKNNKTVERNVLSVLLGEIQNLQNSKSQKGPVTDRQIAAIVRRFIESGEEMIKCDAKHFNKIMLERVLLESFLPMTWTRDQILDWFEKNPKYIKMLREQRADGVATGIAIKLLNSHQFPVEGREVSMAVFELRNIV